jgi:hypothetical protein
MPNDDDLINLEHQVDRHERELQIDGKDIEQLKKDIIDLRQDVRDLLETLGFSRRVPYIHPIGLLPEEKQIYDAAVTRLMNR